MSNVGVNGRPYIGGQAVIEGVMMRSPKSFVVSVRRPDGSVAVREQPWHVLSEKLKFLRWPIFRGALVLAESLHNGFSALKFSAEHGLPPEENGKKPSIGVSALGTFLLMSVAAGADSPPPEVTSGAASASDSKKASSDSAASNAMLAVATLFMVGLFIALPHFLTWLVSRAVGPSFEANGFGFHLVDGVFRIAILLGYIGLIARTKDAQVLFRYHGAEHKAIWTYESDKALKLGEARPFTTRHPRCGTSFLFIVVGVAVALHVAVLPLIPPLHPNAFVNTVLMLFIKIPMAFPIAGVAYELQRWSAKPSCPSVITAMTKPGIWMQSITTIEPTDPQLEIALLSLDRAASVEHGREAAGVQMLESTAAYR